MTQKDHSLPAGHNRVLARGTPGRFDELQKSAFALLAASPGRLPPASGATTREIEVFTPPDPAPPIEPLLFLVRQRVLRTQALSVPGASGGNPSPEFDPEGIA